MSTPERHCSELNRAVEPARPGEFAPLQIGKLELWPPVVLAPMAGVTDVPFRMLCRRFASRGRASSEALGRYPGLFVSEMITARPLVEGNTKTLRLASFAPDESPRSLQLYGVDPAILAAAIERLVGEGQVDHIDMNFGCPVPKVTRRGGGSAIPAKPRLLARLVRAAVQAAGSVPVTIKFRKGLDDDLITFRDAGRIAEAEGCAAVGMHARTAAQFYEGQADWDSIAELKQLVRTIPVLGNGDVWEAEDALRMLRQTGCDGVIVGRGCLGRPWLFAELAEIFAGRIPSRPPDLRGVVEVMRQHAQAMVQWAELVEAPPPSEARGPRTRELTGPEQLAMRAFRKHASWYTKGFRSSAALRERLMHVDHLAQLDALLDELDGDEPFPSDALRAVRGKRGRQGKVVLPAGYLDQLDDDTPPRAEAELLDSGG